MKTSNLLLRSMLLILTQFSFLTVVYAAPLQKPNLLANFNPPTLFNQFPAFPGTSNVIWSGPLTNADGSIRWMTQYEAERYCTSVNMRLPNPLELAQRLLTIGSVHSSRVRATNYPERPYYDRDVNAEAQRMYTLGFEPVLRVQSGVIAIHFYYSTPRASEFYQSSGPLGGFVLWSNPSPMNTNYAHAVSNINGTIGPAARNVSWMPVDSANPSKGRVVPFTAICIGINQGAKQ